MVNFNRVRVEPRFRNTWLADLVALIFAFAYLVPLLLEGLYARCNPLIARVEGKERRGYKANFIWNELRGVRYCGVLQNI